jgi:Tfp pilus assembly protein PilN
MNQKINTLLMSFTLFFLILLLIFSLVGLRRVRNTNMNLENRIMQLNNKVNSLQSEISSINSNIQHELKKQASILSSYDIKLGEINASDLTVEAIVEVVPKEIADDSEVEVTIGDITVKAEKLNNKFVARAYTDALQTHEVVVSVKTNGVSKIETLDRRVAARHVFTEKAKASVEGHVVFKNNKLTLEENIINIVYKAFENTEIEMARIFATVDNMEVWEKDITADLKSAEGVLTYTLSKTFDVSAGSELFLYLDVKETNGITFRITMRGLKPYNENDIVFMDTFAIAIIDKNGEMTLI